MSKQFTHLFREAEGMRIVSSGSTSAHLRSWIGISVLDCGPEDIVPDNVCFGLPVRVPSTFRDSMTWFLTSITNKVMITGTGFISQSANFDLGNLPTTNFIPHNLTGNLFALEHITKNTLPKRVPCVESLQASAQAGDWRNDATNVRS